MELIRLPLASRPVMPNPSRHLSPPPAPPRPPDVHPESSEATSTERRPQFQFALSSLLIFTTVVAVISPLIPGYGGQILVGLLICILLSVIPVVLGVFAFYTRGYRQTFFLGAFAASLSPYLFGARGLWAFQRSDELFLLFFQLAAYFVMQAISCGACGYLALASRRFIERRGWHLRDNDGGYS
jgi:hypothetical protein